MFSCGRASLDAYWALSSARSSSVPLLYRLRMLSRSFGRQGATPWELCRHSMQNANWQRLQTPVYGAAADRAGDQRPGALETARARDQTAAGPNRRGTKPNRRGRDLEGPGQARTESRGARLAKDRVAAAQARALRRIAHLAEGGVQQELLVPVQGRHQHATLSSVSVPANEALNPWHPDHTDRRGRGRRRRGPSTPPQTRKTSVRRTYRGPGRSGAHTHTSCG